ncbi:MAG: hypothetical protein M0035_00385 [Actinomycetota bacterium]|nr:hypothetical protein [Actinomycetota bacterium]
MTDEHQSDRIGLLLRGMATRIEREVVPPEPRSITQQTERHQRRQRYRLVALVTAAVLVAGAVAASVVLPGSTATRQPGAGRLLGVASYPIRFGNVRLVVKDLPAIQKNTPAITSSNITSLQLPALSTNHSSIAFGDGSVWVLEHTGASAPAACGKLVALNAASARIRGSVAIALCPDAVAYGAGSLWVLSFQIGVTGYQLVQVDPSTLSVTSTLTLDGGSGGITPQGDTGAKYLFVTVDGSDVVAAIQGRAGKSELVEISAANGAIIRSVELPALDGPVSALGANSSAVWVGTANGWVLSFNPQSGALSGGQRLGTRVASLSAAKTGVWVTVNLPVPANAPYPGLDTLRLDPTTGRITRDTGLPMTFVSTDGTSVWVLGSAPPYRSAAGLLGKVNPTTGAMSTDAELPVESYKTPDTLGVYQGSAWVINDGLGTLTKVSK